MFTRNKVIKEWSWDNRSHYEIYARLAGQWPPVPVNESLLLEHYVLTNFPPPKQILDIGCGFGSLVLFLKNRGYDVSGIDCNALPVRVARYRGGKVTQGDFTQPLSIRGCPDIIVAKGHTLGMGSKELTQRILEQCQQMSTRGTSLIFDTTMADTLPNQFHSVRQSEVQAGSWGFCVIQDETFIEDGVLTVYRTLDSRRWRLHYHYSMTFLTFTEWEHMLRNTGWLLEQTINSPNNDLIIAKCLGAIHAER